MVYRLPELALASLSYGPKTDAIQTSYFDKKKGKKISNFLPNLQPAYSSCKCNVYGFDLCTGLVELDPVGTVQCAFHSPPANTKVLVCRIECIQGHWLNIHKNKIYKNIMAIPFSGIFAIIIRKNIINRRPFDEFVRCLPFSKTSISRRREQEGFGMAESRGFGMW
jgi:hypothetical protein